MTDAVAWLGRSTLEWLRTLGHSAFFFVDLLRFSPGALRRWPLVLAQVHFIGNLSLLIIAASGLAVGFVLALQMYYALVTYGAAENLGLVVNLALVRELGPVVTALLFAGRAGTSLTAEIGLMKAGEQLAAMELMAIDPRARVLAPRFIGGIVAMPVLALIFSAVGILGAYVVAVLLIGVDAGNFWSLMQDRVDVWRDLGNGIDQEHGVRRHLHLRRAVPGLRGATHAGGRVGRHHAFGRRRLAGRFEHGLHPDCIDVLDTMSTRSTETLVGVFVLLGMAALLFLALKAANLTSFSTEATYPLSARFDNIGGLKARAPVRSAGVTVGRVTGITLDPKTYQGVVSMDIRVGFQFPKDSSAKILTSGLLGDQYVGLEPGADDANFTPGATITQTQSALVLENLIGQMLFNKAAEAGSTPGASK